MAHFKYINESRLIEHTVYKDIFPLYSGSRLEWKIYFPMFAFNVTHHIELFRGIRANFAMPEPGVRVSGHVATQINILTKNLQVNIMRATGWEGDIDICDISGHDG